MIRKFTKDEIRSVVAIFVFLIIICVPNFSLSIKRSRDTQRQDALGNITDFLKDFRDQNSYYPLASEDGRIVACNPQTEGESTVYFPCEWGKDFAADPQADKGITFKYFSNGTYYQILGYLEVTDGGSEYQKDIYDRQIKCGSKICNTGRASFRTPLDVSIDEYQNKLDMESKK